MLLKMFWWNFGKCSTLIPLTSSRTSVCFMKRELSFNAMESMGLHTLACCSLHQIHNASFLNPIFAYFASQFLPTNSKYGIYRLLIRRSQAH